MLKPIAPVKGDPDYKQKQSRYRADLEAMRRNPADWGAVANLPLHPRETHAPPAGQTQASRKTRGRS